MENHILQKDNNDIKSVCNDLNDKIEFFRNHIIIEQNDLLTKELENILDNNEQIINKIKRVDYLKKIREENDNIINGSLNILRNHIIKYGNFGKKYQNINENFNNDIKTKKSRNDIVNILKNYNSSENENINDKKIKSFQFVDSMAYLTNYNSTNKTRANSEIEKGQKIIENK